ncbi:GyrI-like domain-containing protein [Flagellimonas meridianipacifica]|uniref:Putative transcriptional regulator YdeE n=1 Tax=Flagellimonas meridianipacifica TaxID=1080225 RepID=A0A2T0MFT7_9FLAO|nr:GyrI-like domain-containing protein [Allomuricauda pacifica]PRX56425.1 putative transcriptional regulator YdeE [Allomuricauda pacifica]
MTNTKKEELTIVGIAVRTSNKPGKGDKDIPRLWRKFTGENVLNRIPNKVDNTIYAMYTDYEGDHFQPYTLVIGCNVSSLDNIPEDMTVKMVPASNYTKFTAKGDLTKDAVINTWMKIWNTNLKRAYTADIEVYGEKALDPTNGEAEILVATA